MKTSAYVDDLKTRNVNSRHEAARLSTVLEWQVIYPRQFDDVLSSHRLRLKAAASPVPGFSQSRIHILNNKDLFWLVKVQK